MSTDRSRATAEGVRLTLSKAEQAEENRIIRDRVARAVDPVRAEHARQLDELRKLHALEVAALRLELEQERAKHGGAWLRLLPHWFHRHEGGRDA